MSAPRPTLTDAREYVKSVKERFQNKPETYYAFLKVMKDFKTRRIERGVVVSIVKELFKDQQILLLGFNQFLPNDNRILQPLLEEVLDFLRRIKANLQGDDHAYKLFIDILVMYIHDKKSVNEVYDEVIVLFRDHHDMFVEFQHFFPRY